MESFEELRDRCSKKAIVELAKVFGFSFLAGLAIGKVAEHASNFGGMQEMAKCAEKFRADGWDDKYKEAKNEQ